MADVRRKAWIPLFVTPAAFARRGSSSLLGAERTKTAGLRQARLLEEPPIAVGYRLAFAAAFRAAKGGGFRW